MAQKDKVKELVGRGLNSYHTKSLQQIDRIEKKNKEQNHKISILSNELDNDYLTKTEEGSVISLEHSKEGMVYLDELQGNTLVNYCTDGSKEMTLNGDIDVEGTFVTTTEGIDNGKVDVMCEGNTLVNLVNKIQDYKGNAGIYGWQNTPSNCKKYEWVDNGVKIYSTLQDTSTDRYYRSTPDKYGIFKKNRTYIVRMNVNSDNFEVNATILRCFYGNGRVFMAGTLSEVKNGVFVKKATTSSEIEECDAIHSMISLDYIRPLNTEGWVSFQNVMVIDVTDLPSYQQDVEYWRNIEYFEGMKSVGQDDENGHKIEILSKNKNLLNLSNVTGNAWGVTVAYNQGVLNINGTLSNEKDNGLCDYYLCGGWTGEDDNLKLKPNTKYTFSGNVPNYVEIYIIHNTKVLCQLTGAYNNNSFTNSSHGRINAIMVRVKEGFTFSNTTINIQIEEGSTSTSFIAPNLNKKEILMNEPLRSLPNGIKDRMVKIGGKYFIERNLYGITLNGNSNENWTIGFTNFGTPIFSWNKTGINIYKSDSYHSVLSDRFVYARQYSQTETDYKCIYVYNYGDANEQSIRIQYPLNSVEEFRNYLSVNPIDVIIRLETPTYEPLEIEPTLNTYNDITHISNNSIIPCNMKIKNSGYNVIIKPSTLYTVALDTNKSGTVGMNLSGAKGTTTNNVATITTPATLTDDSLRLYGKGIKGSKVRLLEGDKTNWIPSYFEGMKSSFEDKVQDDGSYKMEILSNNKNLFNLDNFELGSYGEIKDGIITVKNPRQGLYDSAGVFKLKTPSCFKGKWITLSTNKTQGEGNIEIRQYDISNNQIWVHISSTSSFKVLDSCEYISLNFNSRTTGTTTSWENIQIEISNSKTSYIEPKSNKIQFSSIEPLRGVGNIKDKFVFKDNKLMIQRNCKQIAIQNSDIDTLVISNNLCSDNYLIFYMENLLGRIKNDRLSIKSNKFATRWTLDGNSKSICEGIFGEQIIGYSTRVYVSIDKKRLTSLDKQGVIKWLVDNKVYISYLLEEPTYEEVPFELQKIILEGYENGTLFIDTNIPPTSTVTYAGEIPIVKATKLNKTEVLNNTNDINDNIIPYLMDMDYRVVCLQLQSENINDGVSMARLFGGAYEMLQRDIQSKRYSVDEYKHRLDTYLGANKITEEEYNKLGDMLNE